MVAALLGGAGCGGGDRGVACGPNVCPRGQVCCNDSCGICTPPGGLCPDIVCTPLDAAAAEPPAR